MLYVNPLLSPQKIVEDDKGRYLRVEISWLGRKTMLLAIYAPNEKKQKFYHDLTEKISPLEYESWCLMGDFNGDINLELDKKVSKTVKKPTGKLPFF